MYYGTDSTCSSVGSQFDSDSVANGSFASQLKTFSTAGTYYLRAEYDSNDANNAAESTCLPLTVTAAVSSDVGDYVLLASVGLTW